MFIFYRLRGFPQTCPLTHAREIPAAGLETPAAGTQRRLQQPSFPPLAATSTVTDGVSSWTCSTSALIALRQSMGFWVNATRDASLRLANSIFCSLSLAPT